MHLEQITWIDSGLNFAQTWQTFDAINERVAEWNGHSITVGFLVYETEDRVALAQTLDAENPHAANVQVIYKTCIVDRKELNA